jgi:hypothetical protein
MHSSTQIETTFSGAICYEYFIHTYRLHADSLDMLPPLREVLPRHALTAISEYLCQQGETDT